MTHLPRLALTLVIIFLSLALGYFLRQAINAGLLSLKMELVDKWRMRLQTIAVFFLLPLAAMLSLWGLPRPEPQLLLLPLLGLITYSIGGGLALFFARLLHLSRAMTGSFYCCGAFNNMGAVGGLVCLLFLGENTIALVALFRLLEEIYYFSLSFPIAKYFASKKSVESARWKNKNFIFILFLVIGALVAGITLNIAHVSRPHICGFAASLSMLSATIIFLFAIGLTLRPGKIKEYLRPSLYLCLIKFILTPFAIVTLAFFLGLGTYDNGIALKVCAVLSAMPVAMTALVPPAIFGLDVDLANSCWIVSTIALLAVLPILFYILPLM